VYRQPIHGAKQNSIETEGYLYYGLSFIIGRSDWTDRAGIKA